jgi:exonuclease III
LLAKKHIDILGAEEVRSKHRIQVTGYDWIGGPDWFSRPPEHQGIGFLVHNQVRGLTSVVSKDKLHEFMWIKLAGKGNVPDTFICVAYCPTHRYPVEKRRSFYAALLESCTSFMSKGDILLVGDFNARLGQISGDRGEANSNGKLPLSLLRSAFADGEDETYVSLLNCFFGCRGLLTREESGKTSIIDYIITSPESITRVQNVHVECQDQTQGANALGNDHNLLFVDWKLSIDRANQEASASRTVWDLDRLQAPEVREAYQEALAGELQSWSTSISRFMELPTDSGLSELQLQRGLDTIYGLLLHHIFQAMSLSIPTKTVGPNSRSWWDLEIQDLVNLRSEAHAAVKEYVEQYSGHDITSDSTYKTLWKKYVGLRQEVHTLASTKRKQCYQILLTKLETDFSSDRRHFF